MMSLHLFNFGAQPCTSPHPETRAEEFASALTHGFGAILSAIGFTLLLGYALATADTVRIAATAVYGLTLLILYIASMGYHCCAQPQRKHRWKIFDHAAIFLLIAGTYTPITLITLRGAHGWTLFVTIWSLAAIGILLKLFFVDRCEPLSVTLYVVMGGLAVVAIGPLVQPLPHDALAWLFGGGVIYTAGILFFFWDRLPYNHAIWHVFVLAGSACHFILILSYIAAPQ
jgi:hemolysin III